MSTLTEQVMTEIEQFLRLTGMAPSAFGTAACGDKHVVRNMRSGKSITLRRADQIRAYIRDYRPGPLGARVRRRRSSEPRASAA